MTAYVVAQITVTDLGAYERYLASFMEVLDQYGGTLLAADSQPQVAEGDWEYEKLILIEFPDVIELRRWAESEEYERIAVDRRSGSHGVILSVRGVKHPTTKGATR